MGNRLTKKYVFECALAGKPVSMPIETFGNEVDLLEKCGLVSEPDHRGTRTVLHNIKITYPKQQEFRDHYMGAGTPVIFRNEKLRKK